MKKILLNRHSIRLTKFDYSQGGHYFVTVCTYNRKCLFGNAVGGIMELNEWGKIAVECWNKIQERFPNVELDEYVVMPNHVHGIVRIVGATLVVAPCAVAQHESPGTVKRAGTRPAPTWDVPPQVGARPVTLGQIIAAFKSMVVHRCIDGVKQNKLPPFHEKIWQRNYYDHVIRNEKSLHQIRQYILDNPSQWETDPENV
ncbi:MAG: hypothetical protein A3J52_00675 [Omnitrophica bacterium RIFCSPHIGHO2_02_FULL_49_9]|nr:MAG: hypothetical protein A3J52_00675 [Omnitrophica bacterium RIFCSPHIGHO2_02_FULL_49_9]